MEILLGLSLVIFSGLGTGTSAWPFKLVREIHFEQYLLVFMFSGIFVFPWISVFCAIPNPGAVIKGVGFKQLLFSNALSACWGVANILYLIGVVRIGAALTGAILSAAGLCAGVIIPMVLKGSGSFGYAPDILSKAGLVVVLGLLVIIVGIVFVSKAGFGREKILNGKQKGIWSGNFLNGFLLVMVAGFLSSGLTLSFVYGQESVVSAVLAQGGSQLIANIAVWAICAFGGGLVNVGFALYLMAKNHSWKKLFERKEELLYGVIIGFQFIISVILLGRGMLLMGALGASVGFAIQQSLQVIGNQLVGFWGGEWKGVLGQPRRYMFIAIILIVIAVTILGYSNTLYPL